MFYYLYKITNKINGKIYVGVHKTADLDDGYMGSGIALKKVIKKHGIENFEKEILRFFDSAEEMFEAESVIVNEEFISRKDVYNIALGGNGGARTNGLAIVKDDIGNIFSISVNDENYLNGLYLPVSKNTVMVEDDSGVKFRVDKKDFERNKNILYKSILKDKTVVKDSNGRFYLVALDDERFLSGVLVGIWKDKEHSEETKQKISASMKGKQSNASNSQFGTCWIYNEQRKENKKIKKEEIESYINNGWIKGRKQKL